MQKVKLFETIRFSKGEYELLDLHLQRLFAGMEFYDIALSRQELLDDLEQLKSRLDKKIYRVRIVVSANGYELTYEPYVLPVAPLIVGIAEYEDKEISDEEWNFKSSKIVDQTLIQRLRSGSGVFDYIQVDEDGFVHEGYRTNVYIERDGRLITPPKSRGVMAGIYREYLLKIGLCVEGDISLAELKTANKIFLSNSLIHLRPAHIK